MIRSKDITDKRLLDMVRVQQARRLGMKIGFNGLNQDDDEVNIEEVLCSANSEKAINDNN